jgi:hypothetical protein
LQLVERPRDGLARGTDHLRQQRVADGEVDPEPLAHDMPVAVGELTQSPLHAFEVARRCVAAEMVAEDALVDVVLRRDALRADADIEQVEVVVERVGLARHAIDGAAVRPPRVEAGLARDELTPSEYEVNGDRRYLKRARKRRPFGVAGAHVR